MKIVKIDFEETRPYRKSAIKEHVSFSNPEGAEWFGIYDEGILVSFYCLVIKGSMARFKSNYTVKYFRGRGCLHNFIEHAKSICQERQIKYMTCFCTKDSINSHLRNGGVLVSAKKAYYVRYSI